VVLSITDSYHHLLIDRARILRGWTRRDLARQAHVDEGTLCDFFAGRRRPTFGTLRALCRVLELPLEDVIAFVAGSSLHMMAF
jgi:transcriptional regulator with XRE-family HTH domain